MRGIAPRLPRRAAPRKRKTYCPQVCPRFPAADDCRYDIPTLPRARHGNRPQVSHKRTLRQSPTAPAAFFSCSLPPIESCPPVRFSGTSVSPLPPDSHHTGKAPESHLRREERRRHMKGHVLRKSKPRCKQRKRLKEKAACESGDDKRHERQQKTPSPSKTQALLPDPGTAHPDTATAQREYDKDERQATQGAETRFKKVTKEKVRHTAAQPNRHRCDNKQQE